MQHRESGYDPTPTAGDAMQVPLEFVRQIPGVNNEKLPERDVGPEEHKRQQQVSKLVVVNLMNDFCNRAIILEQSQHNYRERKGGEDLTCHYDHWKNGRIPMLFERHDAIHRGESSE